MSIRIKVLVATLAFSLVPMIVISIVGFWNAQLAAAKVSAKSVEDLTLLAKHSLEFARDAKSDQVAAYFDMAANQVVSMAANPVFVQATRDFTTAFNSVNQTQQGEANLAENDFAKLRSFYQEQFASEYHKQNSGKRFAVESLFSALPASSKKFQNDYIANNPHPLGSKHKLIEGASGNPYDSLHHQFHPEFNRILSIFGFYDIFLIDAQEGNVVYSVFKEVDFATNVVAGPFASSPLGEAYRKAMELGADSSPVFVDYGNYVPSYEAPASFVAMPVFDRGTKVGVLAVQLPLDRIQTLMELGQSFGENGEAYLVSTDLLPRTDSKLDRQNRSVVSAFRDRTKGKMNSSAIDSALAGKTSVELTKNYLGHETVTAFAPVNIFGQRWALVVDQPVHSALESARDIDETNQAAQASLLFWTAALSILAAVIVIPATLWMIQNLMKPIETTIETLKDIAQGEGDLTRRLDANRTDELGTLAKWFNSFVDRIHDVVARVAADTRSLSSSSTQLSQTATLLADGVSNSKIQSASVSAAAEEMSTNMNQVATSTEFMSNSIKAIASSIDEMNQTIREIAGNAEKSATVARDAASLVEVSNHKVSNLGEAANEIGKVIQVIQDIAEQTNLLALNATIEAARAGEAGKGFAVVATEVKELARQTASATDDIRARILRIQNTTQEAISSIHQISDVVESVNEVASTIASAVEEQSITTRQISENVTSTAEAADVVLQGINQTAIASREISESISRVDEVLVQSENGAQESKIAGTQLNSLANGLTDMIGRFKIHAAASMN